MDKDVGGLATAATLPRCAATTAPPPLRARDADAWVRESRERKRKEKRGKIANM